MARDTGNAGYGQLGGGAGGARRLRAAGQGRAAARAQRHAVPQWAEPAVRHARCALVRRRRHAARLHARQRQGQLPQPLGAHAEVPGRARRRPRHLVRQGLRRPEAARRAADDRHRCRRRQHQRHLARRQAAGARGSAPADRDRSQDARDARLCRLCPRHRRAGHRASQDRSGHRRADLLRLQRHGPVLQGHDLWRDRRLRRRQPLRAVRGALLQHGARFHRHGELRAVPDPAADGQHGPRHDGTSGLRLGARQGRLRRRHEARRLGQGHPLVPRRGLLRLPHHECVGGGRSDRRRRHAARGPGAVSRRRRHADRAREADRAAGAVDLRHGRRQRHLHARLSRRPAGRVPAHRRPPRRAGRTDTAGLRPPPRRGPEARSTALPTSTTRPACASSTSCRTETPRRSRCSCRARPMRRRATAGCWPPCGGPRRTAAISRCSGPPRSTAGRSRPWSSPAACRSACTATGCRRRLERRGGGSR